MLTLLPVSVMAFDIQNGKALHEENCVRCHDEKIYTREERIVNSWSELRDRVRLCELMLELAWFDEEVDDVTAYLNQAYYQFNPDK